MIELTHELKFHGYDICPICGYTHDPKNGCPDNESPEYMRYD
jgi:hypothetical protein